MTVLDDILALAVTEDQAAFLKNGGFVPSGELPASSRTGDLYKAMCDDKIIALCELDEDFLKPVRVFNL